MRPKVIVHCLVSNEERFIWYALNSVLPFVEEIMVWDTGSTDDTVKIISSIEQSALGRKIKFKQLSSVDSLSHTQTRQKMLDETDKTKFDWLMILDGDEIWPEASFGVVFEAMEKSETNSIAVHTINFVGDIYHVLPESAGRYEIAGVKGQLNLRFIRLNLPELKVINPHGGQTYTSRGVPLQLLPKPKVIVLDTAYFHATHLVRSRNDKETLKRFFKRKYELGSKVSVSSLPPLFFTAPKSVPDITRPMSFFVWFLCLVETPLRRIRRILLPTKSGYIHRQ